MANNLSKLPKRDSKEGKEIARLYPTASAEQLDEWTKLYGYRNRTTFCGAIWKSWGLKRARMGEIPAPEPEIEIRHVPYPDFKIKPFPQPKSRRDMEDLGLILADHHFGKVTASYNLEIAAKRLDNLLDAVMSIINLHRPIRKVWVFNAGDNVQGENPHQGSKIGETECGAYEQIHDYAIPYSSRFLISLAQGVSEIEYIGVDGNHGIYERTAPQKTNWDGFFYSGLEAALVNQKNITIHPPTKFYQLVNIRGFRFFLIHGNQVYATQGIPLFAMRRKMQEWYAYVGGFNYGYAGHFHSGAADQVNSIADYTICPPLVTGDEWALEKVGRASEPKQLCFGIHDKHGRSFEYKLYADKDYYPRKYQEPEGVIEPSNETH